MAGCRDFVLALCALGGLVSPACGPTDRPAVHPGRLVGAAPDIPALSTDPPTIRLDVVAFQLAPESARYAALGDVKLDGLSSCVPDGHDAEWLAVSDLRAFPMLFVLSLEFGMGGLRVEPLRATPLEVGSQVPDAPRLLDLEGVTLVGGTRLIVSSEGDGQREPPGLFEYERSGRFVSRLPIPSKYLPDIDGIQHQGIRRNQGFEPLTSMPDGRVFTATEGPLVQDDDEPTVARGAWSRILELVPTGPGWRPGREFAYPVEPMPAMRGLVEPIAVTGLVELLPIDPDRFLAMERSFVGEREEGGWAMNGIRIYEISLADAEDISGRHTLRGHETVHGVDKRLVLDLADAAPHLGPRLANLENFEGMCEGPTLPDRGRSVLLVADNNANPHQRTAFVLLRVAPR